MQYIPSGGVPRESLSGPDPVYDAGGTVLQLFRLSMTVYIALSGYLELPTEYRKRSQ